MGRDFEEPLSLANYLRAHKFCGVREQQLDELRRRRSQWTNKRRLKWFVADRLQGLTLELLTASYAEGFAVWQRVCGLVFEQTFTSAEADFVILARRIDGRGATLAEHELPMGDDRQLRGWFDVSEAWTAATPLGGRIHLPTVAAHEFGHGIGLSHYEGTGALLSPIYNPAIREPQAWDIEQAVERYGPPVEAPPASPQPGGELVPPDVVQGALEMFGRLYSFTAQLRL